MGFLIDSTACIHAERNHRTPEELVSEIMERWGDAELFLDTLKELFEGTEELAVMATVQLYQRIDTG